MGTILALLLTFAHTDSGRLAGDAFAHIEGGELSGHDVLGATGSRTVARGESLIEIARQHDVGYGAIVAANPGVDPWVPAPGTNLTIPTAWILPRAAAPGTIVVNLSEMRLFLFPNLPGAPISFPIGIAAEGSETPVGTFHIIQKQELPTWYPPASIRREEPELPASVPPGPENPLGSHSMRLSRNTILIHGTNKPWGVGRKVTHGCMRLYPEDIPLLFAMTPVGTPVTIVREPVKVGLKRGRIHVEVHEDEELQVDYAAEAAKLLKRRGLADRVDPAKLAAAVAGRRGIPVDVTLEDRS